MSNFDNSAIDVLQNRCNFKPSQVTSQLTIDAAKRSDPVAAAERLKLLDGLPLLDVDSNAQAMATMLLAGHMIPKQAAAEALHAVAALGGVKYLRRDEPENGERQWMDGERSELGLAMNLLGDR